MRLSVLLDALQPRSHHFAPDVECRGLAYDSRCVTPGMIFFALPGARVDGARFAAQAVSQGAVAVVTESDAPLPSGIPPTRGDSARLARARAAAAFHGHPSRALRLIGVTGTNGKTTVAYLVRHLLTAAGVRTGMLGTVEYDTGNRVLPAHRTTPESLDLQQLFATMRDSGCGACVMEVSSHALCQHRVEGVEFHAAAFTNLTRDHLDYHGDMEAYFAAKCRLFNQMTTPAAGGAAVINADDPYGERLGQALAPHAVLTFGLSPQSALRADVLELGAETTRLRVSFPRGAEMELSFPLIGRHNVSNGLAALGLGLAMGVDIATLQRAMEQAPPAPGRLQPVSCGQPFGVFVDYAHTDDALRQVLATLREVTRGRLHLMFGCGGDRDAGKRPRMGAVAAAGADTTLITSDNPRSESPEEIARQIAEGYRQVRGDGCDEELDRSRAIDQILRRAQPGDTVLLAGKGHETYQEYQEAGERIAAPFDDRVHAAATLRHLGS